MVPVDRAKFLKPFDSDPVTKELVNFFYGRPVSHSTNRKGSSSKEMTILALKAIQDSSKLEFEKVLEDLSRRRITDDANWIYDDFLLFALITGARLFKSKTDFLNRICEHRISIQVGREGEVAQTFRAIIQQQKGAPSKYLVLVCSIYEGLTDFDDEFVNQAYDQAVDSLSQKGEAPFRRLLALKAYDSVVSLKGLEDKKFHQAHQDFIDTFSRRASILANSIFYSFLFLVTIVWGYVFYVYLSEPASETSVVQKIVGGGLVLAPWVVLFKKKCVVQTIVNHLFLYCGGQKRSALLLKKQSNVEPR